MLSRILIQTACRLFFVLIGASVACAGSFSVHPIRVTLSDSQKMGTITLRNKGTEPITLQIETLSWSQRESKDVFTATREILSNPPIFTIPVGGSQLIRIGLRRESDAQSELAYRIILQELPQTNNSGFMGAKMLMRVSLPVFVLPEVAAKPLLHWQAAQTSKDALKLSVSNSGNAHIQIKNFKLSLPGSSQPLATNNTVDYILPGQSYEWVLQANENYPISTPDTTLQLFAQTDAGDIEALVIIEP